MAQMEQWNRKWRTLWCWSNVYVGWKTAQACARMLPPEKQEAYWQEKHNYFANLVWSNITELRGWWVKVGQFLSTRGDLLPPQYITHLAKLQDMMPTSPFDVIMNIILKELGDVDTKFQLIEEKALASASIGQVHKAILMNGDNVVVKIQHPDVDSLLLHDMNNLKQMSWAFGLLEPGMNFSPVLDEWQKAAAKELDFRFEMKNQQRAYEALERSGIDVIIPKCYPHLTSKKVMVMEFIEGFKITDAELLKKYKVNCYDLMCKLCDSFAYQIHIDGLFNGDPHPGNILVQVRKKDKKQKEEKDRFYMKQSIDESQPSLRQKAPPESAFEEQDEEYIATPVILDWGLAKEFDPAGQIAFAKLVYAVESMDVMGLMEAFEEMGFRFKDNSIIDPEIYMNALRIAFRNNNEKKNEEAEDLDSVTSDALVAAKKSGIKKQDIMQKNPLEDWPKDIIFFVRVASLLHGICMQLHVNVPFLEIMVKRAKQCLFNRYVPPSPRIYTTLISETKLRYYSTLELRVHAFLTRLVYQEKILGCQICVIKDDSLIVHLAVGKMGPIDTRPVTIHSLFCAYCAIKGVLTSALLKLVSDGLIDLEDKVCNWWDNFIRFEKKQISIRDVLTHKAGLHASFPPDLTISKLIDYQKMIKIVEDAVPCKEKGFSGKYAYLIYGWLVSEIIQSVTNEPIDSYIQREFLIPLKIENDFFFPVSKASYKKSVCFNSQSSLIKKSKTSSERCGTRIFNKNNKSFTDLCSKKSLYENKSEYSTMLEAKTKNDIKQHPYFSLSSFASNTSHTNIVSDDISQENLAETKKVKDNGTCAALVYSCSTSNSAQSYLSTPPSPSAFQPCKSSAECKPSDTSSLLQTECSVSSLSSSPSLHFKTASGGEAEDISSCFTAAQRSMIFSQNFSHMLTSKSQSSALYSMPTSFSHFNKLPSSSSSSQIHPLPIKSSMHLHALSKTFDDSWGSFFKGLNKAVIEHDPNDPKTSQQDKNYKIPFSSHSLSNENKNNDINDIFEIEYTNENKDVVKSEGSEDELSSCYSALEPEYPLSSSSLNDYEDAYASAEEEEENEDYTSYSKSVNSYIKNRKINSVCSLASMDFSKGERLTTDSQEEYNLNKNVHNLSLNELSNSKKKNRLLNSLTSNLAINRRSILSCFLTSKSQENASSNSNLKPHECQHFEGDSCLLSCSIISPCSSCNPTPAKNSLPTSFVHSRSATRITLMHSKSYGKFLRKKTMAYVFDSNDAEFKVKFPYEVHVVNVNTPLFWRITSARRQLKLSSVSQKDVLEKLKKSKEYSKNKSSVSGSSPNASAAIKATRKSFAKKKAKFVATNLESSENDKNAKSRKNAPHKNFDEVENEDDSTTDNNNNEEDNEESSLLAKHFSAKKGVEKKPVGVKHSSKMHPLAATTNKNYTKGVSVLDLIKRKPYVIDPLIYDSKRIIHKLIPPTNARLTAKSLAILYAAISNGLFIDKHTLDLAREVNTKDNSLETLLLSGGGSRTWGLGYQLYECKVLSNSNTCVSSNGNNNEPEMKAESEGCVITNPLYFQCNRNICDKTADKDNKTTFATGHSSEFTKRNHHVTGKLTGYGHGDFGGNICLSFPEINLTVCILLNDILTGPETSREILDFILLRFGLKSNWESTVDFCELLKVMTP